MPNSVDLDSSSNEAALGVTPDKFAFGELLIVAMNRSWSEGHAYAHGDEGAEDRYGEGAEQARADAQCMFNTALSTIKEMREALQELLNSAQPCLRYVASAAYENEYGDLRESIIHARSVLTKYPETNK